MVYPRSIRVLASTNHGHQYRRKAEGPLANVHSSHRDDNLDIRQLRLPPNESRKHDSLCHGYCRSLPPSTYSPFPSVTFRSNQYSQVAKCLKYLGFTTICDIVFGLFMFTWFAARHVVYLMICYSVWVDLPATISYGCYRGKNGAITGPFPPPDRLGHLLEPFRDPEGVVCFNNGIKWAFLSALLFLQVLTLVWFWMIVRVAITVLRGGQADDSRSDDEGEDEEEDIVHEKLTAMEEQLDEVGELQPFEEEVGVEAINLKGRTSNARYRKSASHASGVSLPGHSDRKELLGRIGCDKPV